MTEEHIKEELSRLFVTALATVKGIVVSKPSKDYGVDLRIELIESYFEEKYHRFFLSGSTVDIQLKATGTRAIDFSEKGIRFDLPVRNYNDLIRRRNNLERKGSPNASLVLIVVILPENQNEWLKQEQDKILLNGKAFWYYPSNDMTFSLNLQTQRIWIPSGNKVNLEFFDNVFNLQTIQ